MVAERRNSARGQHLKQRRGGIAAPIGAELVDFVEQEERFDDFAFFMPWMTLPGIEPI